MKKRQFGKIMAIALAAGLMLQPLGLTSPIRAQATGTADYFDIPGANANGTIGATVPYTRYDSTQASIGGGASLVVSTDWDEMNIASQASEQSYVRLPGNGAYAQWTMSTTGAGVTLRFTLPDSADGYGLNSSVDVYVNGNKVRTVDLTSYYMWQYFAQGNPSDTNDGGAPCFAFDEVHFLLNTSLKAGDTIKIQSKGGPEVGVDFIEVEEVADPIDQPANSVNVENFGAIPDDGVDDYTAITSAIAYADANDMDVYIPAGTFHINQTWRLYGSNMKITGAGMWYTNIQFTNPNADSGGISGGWQTSGSLDGYCNNIEFCNMYINSNLRSRYNQQAIYKCFMDVYTDGSVIHDIWEEHFECGFWLGDYNGRMDYSDGLKIVNCRIRNNLADGVNFCQGTSNATVYNCNIRNNGDDGLAMWNNTYGNAKDEVNNVFCYNTIEFIWRAGGIAIYGGSGHHIYNNYLADMFMAAGIHLNTTFDGYKFSNNTGITFDNNILVRCGTSSDSWNEELGAVDIKQSVANVTFNNTQIYDAVHEGIRVLDNSSSGIVFNNTKIFGAGVDGQRANYSSVYHNGAAIRSGSGAERYNGLEIANVAYKGENSPYFLTGGASINASNVTIYDEGTNYVVPSYPTPNNASQGGGVIDLLDGVEGYDLQVVGLAWADETGSTLLTAGEKVSFTAAVRNTSNVNIPAGVTIGLKITVDGKGSYTNVSFKDGLNAGATVAISPAATWTAAKGGHTILAEVDFQDRLPDESNENNNSRSKNINVAIGDGSSSYTPASGGYDLIVTDVNYGKDTIATGENLTFTATVTNAGDRNIPAGTTIGVQFQVDGNTSAITWGDSYNGGLAAGSSVNITANGGTNGNTWTATDGNHTVTAWVDDVNRLPGEVNENNNTKTISISVPDGGVVFFENPDGCDNLTNLNNIYTEPSDWDPSNNQGNTGNEGGQGGTGNEGGSGNEGGNGDQGNTGNEGSSNLDYTPVSGGYDLFVTSVGTVSESVAAGEDVTFKAVVVNAGDRAIPAGTTIGVQFQVDGNTSVITWCDSYNQGLAPGAYVTLVANGGNQGNTWNATEGSHTLTAWVDDVNRLPGEVNENNNYTTGQFTVSASANTGNGGDGGNTGNSGNGSNLDYTPVSGGYDLYVTDIYYSPENIYNQNAVRFSARVVNAGDTAIPAGTTIGVQFQIDGGTAVITWCDSYDQGLNPGEYVTLTANGGNQGSTWSAVGGSHTVTAWVDDVNRLPGEVNENNNMTTRSINVNW
ncbi:MAG: hypothetical protein K6D96_07930 [Acetatifactor sp.]|nr:hypothetical protein [Acetatifactor sp.]